MKVTWCNQCNAFEEGTGDCPQCGGSRNGFDPVTLRTGDWRRDVKGDGGEVAHSHNFRRNRGRKK